MTPSKPESDAHASERAAHVVAHFTPNRRLDLEEILAGLLKEGLILDEQARRVWLAGRVSARTEIHPLIIVANAKLMHAAAPETALTLEYLTQWIARHAQLSYLRIDPTKVDVAAVGSVLTATYAARYRILPIELTEGGLTVATSEPFDTGWIADLTKLLRRKIHLVVANPLDVNRFLMEFYGVTRAVAKVRDAKHGAGDKSTLLNFEQLVELGKAGEIGADDQHIVRIVDWLLQYAYEQRASDIHIEPRRDLCRIRFRIDGVLHKVFELPSAVTPAITARVKILGRMNIAERRRPQDGRIKMRTTGGREVEMRISAMPTAFGEKLVMRLFDPEFVMKSFEDLGFSPEEEKIWRRLVERPHGIVLVTGPTGSGKTTTLYSTLRHLATPSVNVCTIEDPIEMVAPEFNQMQVQPSIDLTFATGVRTLLRQDPDIIMVGEIRDLATAEMAVQAALTGHLVLSTLHTNDAPSAVTRLLDLGVAHFLIQSTLAGVVAQRLVRRLCQKCRQPVEIDAIRWQLLTQGSDAPLPEHAMGPKGCDDCRQTGYHGRTAIYEMMPVTDALRTAIKTGMDLSQFRSVAFAQGMRPLRLSAAAQVASGVTTIEEALSVLPPVE